MLFVFGCLGLTIPPTRIPKDIGTMKNAISNQPLSNSHFVIESLRTRVPSPALSRRERGLLSPSSKVPERAKYPKEYEGWSENANIAL
jgi:hypothetical protein